MASVSRTRVERASPSLQMLQIRNQRTAPPPLFGFPVACIAVSLFVVCCLVSGTAAAQVNPNDVIKLGTELLRLQNDQLQRDETQESVPPTYVPEVQPSQESVEAQPSQVPSYSKAQVTEAQELLNRLGYDAGPVDGLMGGKTKRALQAFQRSNGLTPTGMPDDKVLASLRVLAPPAAQASAVAAEPSFDCTRAATPAEISICKTPALARLDRDIAAAFSDRIASAQPGEQAALRAAQKDWLSQRDACRYDTNCIALSMETRLADLTGSGAASAQDIAAAGATQELSQPDLAAVEPAAGADPLLGLWTGEFVCLGSNLSINLAIVDDFGARHAFVRVLDESMPAEDARRIRTRVYTVPDISATKRAELKWLGGFTGRHRFIVHPGAKSGRLIADYEGCTKMEFQRVEDATEEPADALVGTWSGHFEACSQDTLEGRLHIIHTFPGEYLMDAEVVRDYPAGSGANMIVRIGRKFFHGTRQSDSGTILFRETATLRTRLNGEPTASIGIALTTMDLQHNKDDGRLTGRTDKCEYGEFVREGSEESAVASVSEPAEGPAAVSPGEWEGYAKCEGGGPIPASLVLEPSPGGRLRGLIEYVPSGAISYGVVRQVVIGEPASRAEGYYFVVERTLPGGRGPVPTGFILRAQENSSSLAASYESAPCSSLELTRVSPESITRRPNVPLPADGGTFFASSRPRDKCQAIAGWVARIEAEYPDLDILNTTLGSVYPKVALLFADEDFVPVFGTPFDQMKDDERKEVSRQVGAVCKQDPFFKESAQGFTVVDDAFLQRSEQQKTSFSLSAIYSNIRQARRLRTTIRTIEEDLAQEETYERAVQILEPLKYDVERAGEYLWPTEQQDVLERIRLSLGRYAMVAAEADLHRILALEDISERLKALTAVHAGRARYAGYLLRSDQSNLEARIVDEQHRIAEGQIEMTLATLEAIPVSDEALVQISTLEKEIEPTLMLLIGSMAAEYKQRIEGKRQETLATMINGELAALDAYEPGKIGLNKSADWPARFAALFIGFEESSPYKDAMEKFRKSRSKLLFASYPAFEIEVSEAVAAGRDVENIRDEYLSWEGDNGLPESLIYSMATGGAVPAQRSEQDGSEPVSGLSDSQNNQQPAEELSAVLPRECGANGSVALYLQQPVQGIAPDSVADYFVRAVAFPDVNQHIRSFWGAFSTQEEDVESLVANWKADRDARDAVIKDRMLIDLFRQIRRTIIAFESSRLTPEKAAETLAGNWDDWRASYMSRDEFIEKFLTEVGKRHAIQGIPVYKAILQAAQVTRNDLDDLHDAAGERGEPDDQAQMWLWDSYIRGQAVISEVDKLKAMDYGEGYWADFQLYRKAVITCVAANRGEP